MKKLVIAVDCDDVLVPTTPYFIDAYNKKYGTAITLENSHEASEDAWGASREVQVERLDKLTKTQEYNALGPSDEEVAILKELSTKHSLHLITARKPEERELTAAMLERDLPGVFAEIDLVGWEGSKGEVCQRIGADVLIDDSARHLRSALEYGMPKEGAILFGAYPWSGYDSARDSFVHCDNWGSVAQTIERIANKR